MRANLQHLRKFLWLALVLSCAFAAWSWFRPYSWKSDPGARCKVVGVQVTRDRSNFWVQAHLRVLPNLTHDLQKPVGLVIGGGETLEPADTTFSSVDGQGTNEIWLKFWLESDQIASPLELEINDGKLSIKSNSGVPNIPPGDSRYYISNNW